MNSSVVSDRSTGVKVLHKAAQLLESFTYEEPELTLTALARRCGLHPATASRILGTLEQVGLVARGAGGRTYRLGIKVFELGSRVRYHAELQRLARPYMERLAEQIDESVYLSVFHDGAAVYLDIIESSNPIRLHLRAGSRSPAHTTTSGLLLLAFLDQDQLPAEADGLGEQLEQIRGQGYAATTGLPHAEVASIAVPIRGQQDRVEAALSLCGPAHRLPPERLQQLVPVLLRAAAEISHATRQ